MIRMDDVAPIGVEGRGSISIIPTRLKFWNQMVPLAPANYKFSTHWPCLDEAKDSLVSTIGDVGYWQILVVFLMMMFNIPTVFHIASPEVSMTNHDFWCRPLTTNLAIDQWRSLSAVTILDSRGQTVIDPCHIKDLPYDKVAYEEIIQITPKGILECKHWDYNSTKVSILSQFNLACSRLPPTNVAESVFSLGAAVGGLFTAYLADRIGRRRVLMLSQGVLVVLGFLITNASSYHIYLLFRTLLGAACSAVLLCSFMICLEITGGDWRDILTSVYMFSYSLAYMVLSLLQMVFDNWIYLQHSITLLAIVLLSIWWLVPESPRWILTSRNLPQLMLVLEMATTFNHRDIAPGTFTMMKNLPPMQAPPTKPVMSMLFKGDAIKRLTIVVPFIFFFSDVTYFGLVLNAGIFNHGLFFSGAIEFIATFVGLLMGIKNDVKMVLIANVMSGISCLVAAGLMGSGYHDIMVIVARFFGGIMNSSLSTIVATMYPTLIRTMGLGWGNFFSNMALAVAANIVLLSKISPSLPLVILGISGLLGSFFITFLPGRVSRDLLDLPEEIERRHKEMSALKRESLHKAQKSTQSLGEPSITIKTMSDLRTPSTSVQLSRLIKSKNNIQQEDSKIQGLGEVGNVDPRIIASKKKSTQP